MMSNLETTAKALLLQRMDNQRPRVRFIDQIEIDMK